MSVNPDLQASAPGPSLTPTAPPPGRPTERLALLDAMRIIAANLIVWHHLVYYGPLSDVAYPLIPGLMDFLYDHGRYAVQVFFVMGGFVAAASLGKREILGVKDAAAILWRRYVRIAGPYLVVLVIAVAANALADLWMDHKSISAFPTLKEFLAHTVLIHKVLGYDSLTAGIWYLAIDFQLTIMILLMVLISQQAARWTAVSPGAAMHLLVFLLAGGSLFWFNRVKDWDHLALYFFGSYALGLVTSWVLSGRLPAWCFWIYCALMVLSLTIEWRTRLAVGLTTGLAILFAGRYGWLFHWTSGRWLALGGQWSYSLFLIHFPVCLVVNAWLSQYVLESRALCLVGMFVAYGLSLLAAIAFFYGVERRFHRTTPGRTETR